MRLRGVLLAAGIAALTAVSPAYAAKYNVTATADPGTCDGLTCTGIRAAINAAVVTKGVDDEIDLKQANYLLAGQLTISDGDGLAIVGAGAGQTIISGGKKARVFNVVSGKVSLSHLTATGGAVNDLGGAGILNTAQLTLDHVRVTDSTGTAGSGGGGIANSGSLSIANSLIDGNATTGDGGGIYNVGTADTAASLSIRDSTISGNTATGRIGFGGISSRGNDGNTVTLQRVSVADNTGGSTGAGGLGGVQGTFNVRASIVARNQLASGAAANCAGTITDLGSNLESATDCGFKDKPNSNPGFAAAPVDAGGETPVYRIPAGSPALDLAPVCTGVTDQRDVQRPQGKGCDAGAYEYDQSVAILTGPPGLTSDRNPQFTFSSPEPNPVFDCQLDGPGATTGTFAACATPRSYAGLADGAYTFSLRALNGGPVATRTFTVDTTPPAAPVFTSPPNNSFQQSRSITLAGTAEIGATVTVMEGTTTLGSVATNQAGVWTLPALTNVADGTHTYRATAQDAAGNTGAESTRTVTVDTHAPNAPLINSPAENALLNRSTVALAGTAEAGSTVKVLEGTTLKASGTAAGGNWTLSLTGAADGAHTYTVTATDAAGNQSTATTRRVRVDTGPPAAPVITGPAALVSAHAFALAGTAEPGAIVTVLEGATPVGTATADDGGAWTLALAGVVDGAHAYTARAEDVAHNTSPLSAARTVTVDTSAPGADVTGGPSGPTTDSAPAFPFTSSDAASTFECRLDGPAGQGTFSACVSPKSYSGLPPGDYTFFLRATDPAGNQTVTSRAFTVTVVQQAPPTPTFHQSVVVQPAGGKVLIKRKGSQVFVALDAGQGIPLGSEVDTRHGKVRLSSVPRTGGPVQTAVFYAGLFVVTQSGGITNLRLSEPLAKCPTGRAASATAKKKKPKSRRLWGDGSGAFRTQGRYSAATVRGTKWLVQDSCAGTLTRVARGVVQVNDFVRHQKLVLRKGKHYTAKPKHKRR